MLKEAAAGSQLHWSQIWSCQQSWASALLWCFRTRVMLVVRGLLLLLKLLALAPSLPAAPGAAPAPPHPSAAAPAGCRLLCPHKPCKLLTRASPPAPRGHQWRLPSSGLIQGDCGWQGSLMTALGVCLMWTELFQLSRNATNSAFPTISGKMSSALGHTQSLEVCDRKCHPPSAPETAAATYFALSWKEHFW